MDTGRVDINHVLMQMRAIKEQMNTANSQAVNPNSNVEQIQKPENIGNLDKVSAVDENEPPGFGEMFKAAIDTVNANQKHAGNLAQRYETGDASVDLPEVMIALQKSSVSFQAMTQVRNKMVEAYKEIMNMPL